MKMQELSLFSNSIRVIPPIEIVLVKLDRLQLMEVISIQHGRLTQTLTIKKILGSKAPFEVFLDIGLLIDLVTDVTASKLNLLCKIGIFTLIKLNIWNSIYGEKNGCYDT